MTSTRVLTLVLVLLVGGRRRILDWPWAGPTAGLTGAAGARGRPRRANRKDRAATSRISGSSSCGASRGELSAPDRNPFRFERRASAAPPPRSQAARRSAPIEVVPTEPFRLRRRHRSHSGSSGTCSRSDAPGRVAVLSDGRGNVFDGKEGDVIEGRYRLLRVGNDSADLVYLDGRGRQTIRLSGQ